MRTTIFLSTLYLVFGFFACNKGDDSNQPAINWTNRISQLYDYNERKISVSEGITGTLTMKDGDCSGTGTTCREYPVKRQIRIYNAVLSSQLPGNGVNFITKVNGKLIATVSTDNEGFFQYQLAPGNYSLFIEEDGKLYSDDKQENPVQVRAGRVGQSNLTIDYSIE